jgi:5-methylthioadenosine/S-adenosylhomocysteine deaminase
MATLNGAKALGLEGEIGTLQEGARADVITVDLSEAHSVPSSDDVVAALVYSAQSRDVRDVVVNGQILMRERRLLTIDESSVIAAARTASARLVAQLD